MNFLWNIRLLRGPLRPFLVQKALDALRERMLLSHLRRLPTPLSIERTVSVDIAPFPSDEWIRAHRDDVLAFAHAMYEGRPGLPEISAWRVGDPDPEQVDVRSIHELSRMHHWCAYALAAHIDSAHAEHWCEVLASEIEAFATAYPAERGTHWAFPMGTGLRVYSMLVAWDWARRTGWTNARMESLVAALARDHAESIWVRRERRGGLSTSHYAANLLGLLAVARYLPHEHDAQQWGTFSARELRRELQRQILDDGMSNEGSTGYHRQIVDTFAQAQSLLGAFRESSGWTLQDDVRLARAVARCMQLEQLGMPLIGDNDDGMAMKLTGFHADCSFLYDLVRPDVLSDVHMPSFGLYVLQHEHLRVTLRNGSVGQFGKGGHAHQDQNSLTVCVDGMAFIVDPGSSVYTRDPELRNDERSVDVHATMWWTDLDQLDAPRGEGGLFWLLSDRVRMRVTRIGKHAITGTVAHRSGRTHTRSVEVHASRVVVHDVATGNAQTVSAWFPLHPEVTVEMIGECCARMCRAGITCDLEWNEGVLQIDTMHVAPSFGRRVLTHRLSIHGNPDLRWTIQRRA